MLGAAIRLQLLGRAGARAIEQRNSPTDPEQPLPHEERRLRIASTAPVGLLPDQDQASPSNEYPDAALQQAVHLADLYNWADAAPFFERADESYKVRSASRKSLY